MSLLVLTRRIGEKILVGDDVTITVVGITGGQVRVSVEAPKSVCVDRAEVRERRIADSDAGKGGAQ